MKKKSMKYYSQNGEDYILWNFFDFKNRGFYIDIGAFDGIHLSNTYSLELAGWNGILIEPNPFYFNLCKGNRINSICLNIACIGEEGIFTVDFYVEEIGLLSTIKRERIEDIRSRYDSRGLKFSGLRKIEVQAETLNKVISQYATRKTEIDFVSIDVEGAEIDVLEGFDLTKYSPRILLVESNSDLSSHLLNDLLVETNGYYFARSLGNNKFYARDSSDAERLRSIPLNCKIARNLHPLGKEYTLSDFINGKRILGEISIQNSNLVQSIIFKLFSLIKY